MTREEIDVRDKIITAAIELITKYGNTGKVTIRDIAKNAGVGIGLINYYFQTKDKLIGLCVQRMISEIIDKFNPLYKSLNMTPIEKLRYLCKSTSAFLVENPEISRISILSDLTSGSTADNSSQTVRAYSSVLKEVFNNKKDDNDIFIILHILISSVQVAFLRRNVTKEMNGMDFFDKEQREEFIDSLIDRVLSDHL